ncbi:hypothetical protein GCM10010211_76160 [Streptomyces albospinus]|uniref:Uncharacterized protein n=1 Tax=Streptomyces albospinus TaxID=285515 RepID=A0ABQ2VLV6_9ACTN|nr:hypothetical protein [Streptomyces albospinus]GGU97656.1 hypothetical protein GCM10010211_76160 [Streptomyces albospinus]
MIHLAFQHEEAFSGDFAATMDADRRAIEVLGQVLAGSGRQLAIAFGPAGLQSGELATEDDVPDAALPGGGRALSARAALNPRGPGCALLPSAPPADGAPRLSSPRPSWHQPHGKTGHPLNAGNSWTC